MESYLGEVLGADLGVICTTLPTPHWPYITLKIAKEGGK